MLKIELEDVDELYKITLNLAIITYLQELFLNEEICGGVDNFRLALKQADVLNYLLDQQQNQMKMLQELICKENFAV